MKTATVTVVAALVLASSAIVAVAQHAPLTHGAPGYGAPAHRGGPAHGVPVIDRTAAHGEELHPAAAVGHAPVHVAVVAPPPLTRFALQPAAKTGHDGAPAQPEPAPPGAQARKMSVDEESATKERSSKKRSAKKRDDAEQVVVCAMDGFLYATLVTEHGRVSCILTEGVQR
ncbi:hypothetical protein I4F81_005064 [Pyropia yezoensis]|uniref:Uncharacterized protein n=1 Tax=Pyropia yezoensis TaxID=2788 RepID=A0ACC3BXR6_PYRYE|nr:hypothetical protein I4F81_005064 [Neopyropia yezoensis]